MGTRLIDTYINILDRKEAILYQTLVPDYAVNSAFVVGAQVSSENTLQIVDRSGDLSANRVEDIRLHIVDTQSFTVQSESFVVTDIFVEGTNEIELPLFYKHVLNTTSLPRLDTDIFELDPDYTLIFVEVLDTVFRVVNNVLMTVDHEHGIVYSNFQNRYASAQDYECFYVKYTVRNNATGVIYAYTDLLNQEPAYRMATFDDLDESSLLLKTDGRKVYTLDPIMGAYSVRLPQGGHIAYQHTADSKISVLPPPTRSTFDSWYVKVSNGAFLQTIGSLLYKYYIGEFYEQTFNPYAPLKQSYKEESTVIGGSLIKSDYGDIVLDTDELIYLDIILNDADGVALAAYTTDVDLDGTPASNGANYSVWTPLNHDGIKSVDKKNGLVEIDGLQLRLDYQVEMTYHYTETAYEFTLVDLNPLTNRSMLSNSLVLFVVPDLAGVESSKTLYYLILDENGLVIETDWLDLSSYDPIYYRALPSYLVGSPPAHEIFVDLYTTEGAGEALVLGEVSTINPASLPGLTVLDTRIEGGGLKESRIDEAIELQPEVRWFHNIGTWNGVPYPGTANFLVEIPSDLVAGSGGDLSPALIKEVMDRHVGAGIYPVVRQYAPEITLLSLEPTDTDVTLEWEGRGFPLQTLDPLSTAELAYNIYYKTINADRWTLANVTPVVESISNSYTILGLSTSVTYDIVIVPGSYESTVMTEFLRQPLMPDGDTALHLNSLENLQYPIRSFRVKLPLR